MDNLAAGKYIRSPHHRGQPPRQWQLTMCAEDNATQHQQSGPGRRGGVGWLVFVQRERLMQQLCSTMTRGGDGERQSVCFHQRIWTVAVFFAANALQGRQSQGFYVRNDHLICYICDFFINMMSISMKNKL